MRSRLRRIVDRNVGFWAVIREGNAAVPVAAIIAALKACSITKELAAGRRIHQECVSSGLDSLIQVSNTLVSMYAKCGSFAEARQVFEGMQERDVVSWNALILGYAINGEADQALKLFFRIQGSGWVDSRTFVSAVMACSSIAEDEESCKVDGSFLKVNALNTGTILHAYARKLSYDADVYVASNLVVMYSKCGSMSDAKAAFDTMVNPCVVPWTALIFGYAENGQGETALKLFRRMQSDGCCEPNARTFVAALVACASLRVVKDEGKGRCLEIGRELRDQAAKRGLDSELFVASSLIDTFSKCGSVAEAWDVFCGMKKRDVVSWTSMILGYADNGQGKQALAVFQLMQAKGCSPNGQTYLAVLLACSTLVSGAAIQELSEAELKRRKVEYLEMVMKIHSEAIKTDIFVENALLDLYAKCASLRDARAVFDRMKLHNVVSWTALILGYAEDGQSEVALELFAAMKSCFCSADAQVYVAALVACSSSADSVTGRLIHGEICRQGLESNEFISNCLVDLYGRCGNTTQAQRLFDSMVTKDVVAWSSLLAGFGREGDTSRVFELFEEMREAGVEANGVTLLSVLSACGHAGLVEKGRRWFESMSAKFGVRPGIEHHHCVIDLLGRAGHLEEALAVVEAMPYEANVVTWTTMLSACEKWKNVEMGRNAFKSLLRLDDKLPAAYSLMANLYGSAGLLEEQLKVERDAQNRFKCIFDNKEASPV